MIKAVIFDFFGVLANEGTVSFARAHYPDDQDKRAKTGLLQDRLNLATITYDKYVTELAKLGGVDEATTREYLETHKPNRQLLDYIRDNLKPHYRIGLISNAGDNWLDEILEKQDIALFDDIILSYQIGFIKPQPEIYKLSAKNLAVQPQECVFVDDIERYCDGARQVGMSAILYHDFEQMKAELEKLLATADN